MMTTLTLVAPVATAAPPVKDPSASAPVLITPVPVGVAPPLVAAPPVAPVAERSPYTMGTGGTPFSVVSGYAKPCVSLPLRLALPVTSPYGAPPTADQSVFNPNTPVPPQPTKPSPNPLDVMGFWYNTVTGTQVPGKQKDGPPSKMAGWQWRAAFTVHTAKPSVAPVPEMVPTPRLPTVAGFDLNTVPVWGWVVVAFVGYKLLVK
jgi:hypothetical protein